MDRTEYNRAYYLQHKEQMKASAAANYHANREKRIESNSEYRERNKAALTEKYRDTKRNCWLRNSYGITLEEKRDMQIAQNNKCAICDSTFISEPHVDHCHATGNVRGLLCGKCNKGLGMFEDDIDVLLSAARYITKHSKENIGNTRGA